MKVVLVTDAKVIEHFLESGKIEDYSCIEFSEDSKSILKEYVEMNTGFENALVVGISSINGEHGLDNIYEDVPVFLELRKGMYALEFDVDMDLIVSCPYDRPFCSYEELESIVEQESSMQVFLAPILTYDYFVDYRYVDENWNLVKPDKPLEEMIKVSF